MKIFISIIDDKKNQYEGEIELIKVKSRKKLQNVKRSKISKPPTATTAVRQLYNDNFFKNKKTLSEAGSRMSSKGLNFRESHIFNALKRATYLQRKGKRGSYTFIHKYPPQ
ncbi:MAG: hypothetical protein IIA82_08060 [Thaumarchaeota archaeon]|nr:hypothetical protein [Nitrososphaerota archaeon]